MILYDRLHAVPERGSGVQQPVTIRVHYEGQNADQEAVRAVSDSDYHSFRPWIDIFHPEALFDGPRAKISVVLLYILQQVIVDPSLVGNALVAGPGRMQTDGNVSGRNPGLGQWISYLPASFHLYFSRTIWDIYDCGSRDSQGPYQHCLVPEII